MSDLAEWLLAQIAEDEALAEESWPYAVWLTPGDVDVEASVAIELDGPKRYARIWQSNPGSVDWGWVVHDSARKVFDRDRMLAECKSKRRIVERYVNVATDEQAWNGDDRTQSVVHEALWDTLLDLASVYADRPGYDERWRA